MVFAQLQQDKYEHFTQQLIQKARQEPLNASFDVTMAINGTEYIVKLQPAKKRKVYILQALKVERQGTTLTDVTSKRTAVLWYHSPHVQSPKPLKWGISRLTLNPPIG